MTGSERTALGDSASEPEWLLGVVMIMMPMQHTGGCLFRWKGVSYTRWYEHHLFLRCENMVDVSFVQRKALRLDRELEEYRAMAEKQKPATDQVATPVQDRVKFDYIKGNFFRVVHADGIFGGVTPSLDIHMDVWSQRSPIPKQVVHEVKPDKTVGEEIVDERVVRDAIVREVEVGVVFNFAMAKLMVDWLNDKISFIEEHLVEQKDGGEDKK